MKTLFTLITAGVFILYPFAVFFGLHYFTLDKLGIVLLTLLFIRLALLNKKLSKMPWLLPASCISALAIIGSVFFQSILGFKLYPLIVNLSMLFVFAYSLLNPPTVIESFARIKEPNLSEKGIQYTTKVTIIWCLFFILNGVTSSYTAFFASLDVWMIYNGFISYVLMGMIMLIEYIVRLKVKHKHRPNGHEHE